MEPEAAAFQRDVLADVDAMKRELGYTPTRFLQMIGEHGAVEACRQLVSDSKGSDGFTKLYPANRLDMSVEACVLRPWYAVLFSDDERYHARDRLVQADFNVDAYLRRLEAAPPDWWAAPG